MTVTSDRTRTAKPSSTRASRTGVRGGLLDPHILWTSAPDALRKLDPRTLWRNPVMFIVEVGAVWATVCSVLNPTWFGWMIVFWLWLTVLFANLAEAVAEGRGKAQADSLRRTQSDTVARRLVDGVEEEIAAPLLQQGDTVVIEARPEDKTRAAAAEHAEV